jgi:hypothetical protein
MPAATSAERTPSPRDFRLSAIQSTEFHIIREPYSLGLGIAAESIEVTCIT